MPRSSPVPDSAAPPDGDRQTPGANRREGLTEQRAASDQEAKALASALRIRILRMTFDDAMTNREIAELLGKNPATVLHHVRTLVDTGFLEALEPRRGNRSAREIPYRATGKSWYTDSPVLSNALLGAFVSEIEQAPADEVGITRFSLRLPPEEIEEFRDRIHAVVEEFNDRPRHLDQRAWSVFIALHPQATQQQDDVQPG